MRHEAVVRDDTTGREGSCARRGREEEGDTGRGTRTHPDERIDRMLVLELLFWRLGSVALQPDHDDLWAHDQYDPRQ